MAGLYAHPCDFHLMFVPATIGRRQDSYVTTRRRAFDLKPLEVLANKSLLSSVNYGGLVISVDIAGDLSVPHSVVRSAMALPSESVRSAIYLLIANRSRKDGPSVAVGLDKVSASGTPRQSKAQQYAIKDRLHLFFPGLRTISILQSNAWDQPPSCRNEAEARRRLERLVGHVRGNVLNADTVHVSGAMPHMND